MRREFILAAVALTSTVLAAQRPAPPTDTTAATQANEPIYKIGGHISAPVLIHRVTADYSDEARRAKYQGVCLVRLIVDKNGEPQNVHVVRALGMGLDEKAIEAVKQYRFKPAMNDGKTPVPAMITIEVDFRLYSLCGGARKTAS